MMNFVSLAYIIPSTQIHSVWAASNLHSLIFIPKCGLYRWLSGLRLVIFCAAGRRSWLGFQAIDQFT